MSERLPAGCGSPPGLGSGSSWRSRYPHAGPLLTQPIQTQLIADHWNDCSGSSGR
jgi:hypothetical protein